MKVRDVQTLVLRPAAGRAVAHLILRVPDERGQAAAAVLRQETPSFGPDPAASPLRLTVGFTFAGLEALGMPDAYLRIFRIRAAAFAAGAVRRSDHLGDGGASAPHHWTPAFRQDHAHVLLSWHGDPDDVALAADDFAARWTTRLGGTRCADDLLHGARLAAPADKTGDWIHFGYRDGISEVCIDQADPRPKAPDRRDRLPGALLLNEVNDAGFNAFPLNTAPEKVRNFFADSSFGVLRPLAQDVAAFERQVSRWADQIAPQLADLSLSHTQRVDLVKAKLCGRWPDGRPLRPGDLVPHGRHDHDDDLKVHLGPGDDVRGEGCPFGSHLRRMRSGPDGHRNVFERPLQRRGLPFGSAWWAPEGPKDEPRGHLAQFFCASLEDQFEHLLGQWAAGPPLGLAAGDTAMDPVCGTHEDPDAAFLVPQQDRPTVALRGFGGWTTTLGTLYAWHPGAVGWQALLGNDFVPEEDERPWL